MADKKTTYAGKEKPFTKAQSKKAKEEARVAQLAVQRQIKQVEENATKMNDVRAQINLEYNKLVSMWNQMKSNYRLETLKLSFQQLERTGGDFTEDQVKALSDDYLAYVLGDTGELIDPLEVPITTVPAEVTKHKTTPQDVN